MPTSEWKLNPACNKWYREISDPATGAVLRYEYAQEDSNDAQASTAHVPQSTASHASTEMTHVRSDSGTSQEAVMAPAAPANVRLQFHGTPSNGWYERLDSRYRMRTSSEAHAFFKVGRVFAMLWSEAASETMLRQRDGTENTSITIAKFGERVYSQIRRFVIVQVHRKSYFVHACAISTYRNQGVTKPGCRASDHTVVYLDGTSPVEYAGERERGMVKEPIKICPSDPGERMEPASRLRFGKIHSVEWNVKVRDIGMVSERHKTRLLKYFKESLTDGFDNENEDGMDNDEEWDDNDESPQNAQYTHSQYQQTNGQSGYQQAPTYQYAQVMPQNQHTANGYQNSYGQVQYASHQFPQPPNPQAPYGYQQY